MNVRPILALAVLTAAPFTALAAPSAPARPSEPVIRATPAPAPAALAPAAGEVDMEERLGRAIRALPAQQRAQLQAALRPSAAVTDQQPVTGQLRPNTFATMRARLVRPRDTTTADPSIAQRYVRKLDALCRVMPADARRSAGIPDDACTKLRSAAGAAPT